MIRLIKTVLRFCRETLNLCIFLLRLVRYRCFSNPIKKKKQNGTFFVLANGPSLAEALPRLMADGALKNNDSIVLNYFPFDERFFDIKPKHYCLADPHFSQNSYKRDEVMKLYKILEERIDWDMNLYVPGKIYCKNLKAYSKITNKFIHIIPLNVVEYGGFENLRFFFYKKGLSMPGIHTVAQMAIYAGLQSGYKEIDLYGVDHDFFDSLCINENNELCNKFTHFYAETAKLEPMRYVDGSVWKIADWLKGAHLLFKSHDILAGYAKSLKVKILNCTKGSMIDSYERKPAG